METNNMITGFYKKNRSFSLLGPVIILLLSLAINIKASESTRSYNVTDDFQQVSVRGVVTDASTNEPMAGVNIMVKGTSLGSISGANGEYSLPSAIDNNAVLVFSFIGYITQEVDVSGRTVINVSITPEVRGLDEVVVIGYGTAKRATLTGSVAAVEGAKLTTAPSINITNTLAGRLPGLVAVTRSGEPGADNAMLRIRGANTLGDNSPLIVVDGIANRRLIGIDPADIETISILKDASAAIYGAQAANGVILITTKRGSTGKPQITVTANQGISMPTVLPEMADAPTYAQMVNEVHSYRGRPPQYTEDEIQKFRDGSDPWLYPNTDWFAETYKRITLQNNINFLLDGGSEKIKYFFSAGYKYQDGNYKNSGTNYKQFNFRSNIDGEITDNIKLSIDISGRQENRNYPTRSSGTIFGSCLRSFPTMPAYWPNGLPGPDIERGENPVVMATSETGYDRSKLYTMESNMRLNINIPWIKGLSLTGNASIDKSFGNNKLWQTPYYLYGWDRVSYDDKNQPLLIKAPKYYSEPRLRQSMSEGLRTTLNALINYEHTFSGSHAVKILAGIEGVESNSMNFWAFRRYYISTVAQELFAGGADEKNNDGSSGESARMNYFGRINYNFMEKYMAEFVWRYDGSYMFPKEGRFGFFPGVSLGWRISEEEFWQNNVAFINYFKLRGSWGQTGNDRIEEFQYLSTYGFTTPYVFDNNIEVKTLREQRIPNTEITWEVANQTNIGFDSRFLNDKITFSADYFYNLRSKILWQRNASVPVSTGLTLPRENIGKVLNQGFEFEVGYNNTSGAFNYQVSLNGAYQKNKIKFWDETPGVPDYQKSTGYPMGSRLLYQAIGIFRDEAALDSYPHWAGAQPGDIIFEDVNKDGEIDGLDMKMNYKTDLPRFTGGIDINLGYKNFYANLLFQGAAGAVTIHYTNSGLFGNYLKQDAVGRWTEDNPDASKPRAWNFSDEYWMEDYNINNTYFLKSTDYLRLKNAEIGYNMPASINKRLGIKACRIYINGLNVLTLTKLLDYDPETNSYAGYPPIKVFNAGISLTF